MRYGRVPKHIKIADCKNGNTTECKKQENLETITRQASEAFRLHCLKTVERQAPLAGDKFAIWRTFATQMNQSIHVGI